MAHFERNGSPVTGDIHLDDVVVPFGNLALWSDEELAAIGITRAEDPTPTPPAIDDAMVRAECARRIYAAASAATQANLNGYMNLLNAKAISGQALTAEEQADVSLFAQAMAWISAMRGTVPGLIGDAAYTDDSKWPVLSDDLKAFAARF